MPRTNLDTGLQDLQMQILHLAFDVEGVLATTLTALETGKYHILPQIIEHDSKIDESCVAIEQQALRLLILQQPLGGQDLRFLTAVLHISVEFGRIGDAIVQIAQTLQQAASLYYQATGLSQYAVDGSAVNQQGLLTDVFVLRGLLFLGQEIQYILSATVEAFTQRNAVMANTIKTERDLVELRYTPICQSIIEMQEQIATSPTSQRDTSLLQRITYLLWIAHKLAEIATYVTAICKRIVFIVEGN